ncbi:MAG: hypothetical protein WC373_12610 [Smithella sp.]|jgi:hypothetical protein
MNWLNEPTPDGARESILDSVYRVPERDYFITAYILIGIAFGFGAVTGWTAHMIFM